jgi:hypothetical protein
MTFPDLPLTASDLHAIADAVEEVEKHVDGDGLLFGSKLLGRVELHRPDSDNDDLIGYVTPCDGWYGFVIASGD